MPAATAPGSAPVNPASGSPSTGQPAVVRQTPTAQPAHTANAPLTENALAATITGTVTGAASTNDAAAKRLRLLLDAVARQQPQLQWAIGDLEDGTTVLVTDIAGGWIPPAIQIPTGIRLLPPGERRGSLTALLGPAIRAAGYVPGQYLPPVDDTTAPAMSVRARDTVAVDDLGWELVQATKWRDGLPRLAHTLAKAACARTGCLDDEVELLRDYIASIARTVMANHPETVDAARIGNWQLLATIDALLNGERALADYHFAWFQAQSLTRQERR
jgi:hypothetical protein